MNDREGKAVNETRPADRVFVSFASANQKKALELCSALEQRGIACWISCRDVPPGANYQEAIVRALQGARAMLLVFSKAANASDEIKKELSLASRDRIPVVVVRIEKVQPTEAFAYELSTRQWIDALGKRDLPIDAIVAGLSQANGPGPRLSTGGLKPTMMFGLAAFILLAAALAGWFWLKRPSGSPAEALQVRLGGFQADRGDMPATLRDELIAAFGDDGIVRVTTAAKAPGGSGPDYVLRGTIRHEGDQLKIIARLADERTGTTLWSNTYNSAADQIARMPRQTAIDISMVARCGLFGASTYKRGLPETVLADYFQFCQHGGDEADKALDFARKVAAAVPDFSWGWSAVEIAAFNAIVNRPPPDQAARLRQEALAAADRAIKLDRTNSEALAFKSHLIDQDDLVARERLLQQAIAARTLPCGCEHHFYGDFLMEVGRVTEAIAEYERSVDILSLNADTQQSLAQAYYTSGRPDLATKHLAAAFELDSDPQFAHQMAATLAPITGDYAGGLKAINDPEHGAPPPIRPVLSAAFEALSSKDPAKRVRAIAAVEGLPPPAQGGMRVSLLGALGAGKLALDAVVQAAEEKKRPGVRSWLFSPAMAGALRDPEFPEVARRLGLTAYWHATHTKPDVCAEKNPPTFCTTL